MAQSTLPCPCHSSKSFAACCEPFLNKTSTPQTPLELMRSRYSAYTLKNIDYLLSTQCSVSDPLQVSQEIAAFANAAEFQHLEIVSAEAEYVEFKAYFILDGKQSLLHERSRFTCNNGTWCYADGELYNTTFTISRNDSCICQSGKKYKKCCALKLR